MTADRLNWPEGTVAALVRQCACCGKPACVASFDRWPLAVAAGVRGLACWRCFTSAIDAGEVPEPSSADRVELVESLIIDCEPRIRSELAQLTDELLGEVESIVARYVRLPDAHALRTVGLWVLHTHAIASAFVTPYLLVMSAEKGSGKSRLLEVLECLARHAIRASSITGAAIFQLIEAQRPTLLIDEIDAAFGRGRPTPAQETLRGITNAGNRRGGAVYRGTADGTPQRFETFCPKVMAGIDNGAVPDTIRDRSVTIRMARKLTSERVQRLALRELERESAPLRGRLEEWSARVVPLLAAYEIDPQGLNGLSDRALEAWEPLCAIASLADTLADARAAALALSGEHDDDNASTGQKLLAALREEFETTGRDQLFTSEIVAALNGSELADFGSWNAGRGIMPRDLGRLLRPYGVIPRTVRHGTTAKGYRLDQFADAFARYLPVTSVTASQPSGDRPTDVTDVADVTSQPELAVTANPRHTKRCDGVTAVTHRPLRNASAQPGEVEP